jgi:hypothetical protein
MQSYRVFDIESDSRPLLTPETKNDGKSVFVFTTFFPFEKHVGKFGGHATVTLEWI